jgi:hypothetical protein
MKKIIIAALVGGIILFMWQFVSWTLSGLHTGMQKYTPKQDEILKYLGDNLEEGFYYLPTYPEGTSNEEAGKIMENSMGKPWAQVYYHKSLDANMGVNMVRGLVVDILAVLLLSWLLMKMGNASMQTIILTTLAVGFIGYLTDVYTKSIWFETKTLADLIDVIVGWGVVGVWLGWWLRRK